MPLAPEDGKKLVRKYDNAKSRRSNWEWHWQEVADLVLPTRDFTVTLTPGVRRRNKVFDTTAPNATTELAAAMHGLLTNPAIRWFALKIIGEPDVPDQDAAIWLYLANTLMLDIFNQPASLFATSSHEIYQEEVAFGTGVVFADISDGKLAFRSQQITNIFLVADENDEVYEVFRAVKMCARDMIRRWGEDGVSDAVSKATRGSGPLGQDQEFLVVHYVGRRDDRDPEKIDSANMPYASVYFEHETANILSESGFNQMPYLTPRWDKAAKEVYGRGPAMNSLPTIKVVNAKVRNALIATELAVRPPVMFAANILEGPLMTQPGASIPLRPGTRGTDFPRPMDTGSRPDQLQAFIEEDRRSIERAFFLDIFTLPDNDRMTATEIIERRQQGLIKLSPVMSRQYSEWLSPLIARTYNWLLSNGLLPPMPRSLLGKSFGVEYVSPMALAQRSSEAENFNRFIAAAAPLANVDPKAIDRIDTDKSMELLSKGYNVDPRYLRDMRATLALRNQREAQQAQALQTQQAAELAGAAKDASQALSTLQPTG